MTGEQTNKQATFKEKVDESISDFSKEVDDLVDRYSISSSVINNYMGEITMDQDEFAGVNQTTTSSVQRKVKKRLIKRKRKKRKPSHVTEEARALNDRPSSFRSEVNNDDLSIILDPGRGNMHPLSEMIPRDTDGHRGGSEPKNRTESTIKDIPEEDIAVRLVLAASLLNDKQRADILRQFKEKAALKS